MEPATETESPTEYVWIPELEWIEADEQFEAFCEWAQSWIDAHEPDTLSMTVRPPRAGEAGGMYEVRPDRTLQILGYTIPTGDHQDASDLIEQCLEAFARESPELS